MIENNKIIELLRVKGKHFYHREGQCLEFKEQFNFAGLSDYFRDFAAFANNKGGHLIFGVTDAPREATGLNEKSLDQFSKLDPEKVTGFILELFSSDIGWENSIVEHDGKFFGVFKVEKADVKPVICRNNQGPDQTLKNGEIYYRYGGRTQKIQSAELESIINERIKQTNSDWIDLVQNIGVTGPKNAFVLKAAEEAEANKNGAFIVDQKLADKIKFVKEGNFKTDEGAITLKLIGDVVPMDTIEVEKVVKENLLKDYPYSAVDLAKEVTRQVPTASQHDVWRVIRENGLKSDATYSRYNFRNRKHEEAYVKNGTTPSVTPSIYNDAAIVFICDLIRNE